MTVLDHFYQIFLMLGGLAVFMFGMKIMGENLERVAGGKMRGLMSKVSNNRFAGVGIGTAVTLLIQSSSATTVMLVGFVNVGLISLFQSAAIIMGANIGTTITAQIASLSIYKDIVNITAIFSMAAFVGIFLNMFSSNDKVRRVGLILAGLGMLFVGLDVMSTTMNVYSSADSGLVGFIETLSNPFVMLLVGTLFTALIQSSSAATGILIPMVATGVMALKPSLYFVLGTNIGTCITAMFASIGTNTNGRRAAFVHLLFNMFGAVLFTIILLLFSNPIIAFLELISGSEPSRQLANFHTIFNILITLILLPCIKYIVLLSEKIIKDKSENKKKNPFKFIDELILETPPVAVAQSVKEVIRMNDLAKQNLSDAIECLHNYDVDLAEKIDKCEDKIDVLNRGLTKYLVKLSGLNISEVDENTIGSLYHVISDIERIGDYATNIKGYGRKIHKNSMVLTDAAKKEVELLVESVMLLYRDVLYTFETRDKNMLKEVARREDEVNKRKKESSKGHISRLKKGECSAEIGAIYLSLISNLERVGDHLTNIAYSIDNFTGAMTD